MEKAVSEALTEASFRIGDYGDFLELSDEERTIVELRVAIVKSIRNYRESQQLTQKQLAGKIKSSQSRVAKIEAGATGISLDLLLRALVAVGGRVNIEIVSPTGMAAKSAHTKADAQPKSRRAHDVPAAHAVRGHANPRRSARSAAKPGSR
jgi:transcriptional regulator with XRE-family HTH domain